jgi:hypothetical protein
MIRKLCCVLFAAAIALATDVRPADAAPPISSRNPYRSFNISGVNYCSVRWEQSHRGRFGGQHRLGGFAFRRR